MPRTPSKREVELLSHCPAHYDVKRARMEAPPTTTNNSGNDNDNSNSNAAAMAPISTKRRCTLSTNDTTTTSTGATATANKQPQKKTASTTSSTQQRNKEFGRRLIQLAKYKLEHHNARATSSAIEMPLDFHDDPELVQWVRHVQADFDHWQRHGTLPPHDDESMVKMTMDQLVILQSLGVCQTPREKQRQKEQEEFDQRLLQLADYKNQHGSLDISFDDDPNQDLVAWIQKIKQAYRVYQQQQKGKTNNDDNNGNGTASGQTHDDDETSSMNNNSPTLLPMITEERIRLLTALGLDWTYITAADQRFHRAVQHLKDFQQEFHHVNVPSHYKERDNLGYFVQRCRVKYRDMIMNPNKNKKQGKKALEQYENDPSKMVIIMTPEKAQLLQNLGLDLQPSRETHWETRFQELVAYKERFGHTNVPQHWPENKPLGVWVNTTRKLALGPLPQHKPGTYKVDWQERIDRLNAIGFEWKVRDRFFDRDWDKRFASLVQFQQRFGHCAVPIPVWEKDKLLSRWVVRVRDEYKAWQKNPESSKLNQQRMDALEQVEFCWQHVDLPLCDEIGTC